MSIIEFEEWNVFYKWKRKHLDDKQQELTKKIKSKPAARGPRDVDTEPLTIGAKR